MASLVHKDGRITLIDSRKVILSQGFWWEDLSERQLYLRPTDERAKAAIIMTGRVYVDGVAYCCNTDHIFDIVARFRGARWRWCYMIAGEQYVSFTIFISGYKMIGRRKIPYDRVLQEMKPRYRGKLGADASYHVMGKTCGVYNAQHYAICAVTMDDEPAAC